MTLDFITLYHEIHCTCALQRAKQKSNPKLRSSQFSFYTLRGVNYVFSGFPPTQVKRIKGGCLARIQQHSARDGARTNFPQQKAFAICGSCKIAS